MTAPYTAGTISLVSGSEAVAGIDTAWAISLIVGGTIYVEFDGGNPMPIATVDSDTEITAALKWTGPTGTYFYAIVRDTAYGQQTVTNAQALATYIQRLNNPALAATAGVTPGSNKLLLFTGANSATVIDLEDILQGVKFDEEVPTLADRANYDGEAEGFRVLVANIGDGRSAFYTKKSAAVGDWTVPFYISGPVGGAGPYTDITIGPTETLPAGSDAEVTLVPVSPGVIRLDFGLPKGADGTGTGDFVGPAGDVAAADILAFADVTGKAGRKATPAEVRAAGQVGLLAGFRNKLINSLGAYNQRGVSGTVTLAAGAYGHDGFKAGSSGCTYTFASNNGITTFTITAGSLQQVVPASAFSGEAGTYYLTWSGTAQGRINGGAYAASGVPNAALSGAANATAEWNVGTLLLPQLEQAFVSDYRRRPDVLEKILCRERHRRTPFRETWTVAADSYVSISFPAADMRATPAASYTVSENSNAKGFSTGNNQFAFQAIATGVTIVGGVFIQDADL